MSRTKPARFKTKHPTFANKRREFACDDDLMSFNSTEAPRIVGPKRTDELDRFMDRRWQKAFRQSFDHYEQHLAYLLKVMNLPNSNHLPNPLPPDMVALIRSMEEGDNRE